MSMRGWELLSCECGSDKFIVLQEIRWQESQGTSVRQAGYQCSGCAKRVETGRLIARVKERFLQEKIDELKAHQGHSA